ncbi:polymerase [Cohaesibacter celericrescens]|uniref:Polymerase n=2 Tax=Cohaesibacter celericrescens TaxID=2067669 RepID=A0A2N5XNC2_9HYPH|nr:polymerase [Cohaesibacter celericrescens]
MTQFEMFPVEAYMRRIDREKNMYRFYHLQIERTLFGEWCLVRRWGRIGANGQIMRIWFDNISDALAALKNLAKAKGRRGYVV